MRAFVDSIETGIATLLLGPEGEVTVRLPAGWLPGGTREGDVLRLDFTPWPEESTAGQERISRLLGEMDDSSGR